MWYYFKNSSEHVHQLWLYAIVDPDFTMRHKWKYITFWSIFITYCKLVLSIFFQWNINSIITELYMYKYIDLSQGVYFKFLKLVYKLSTIILHNMMLFTKHCVKYLSEMSLDVMYCMCFIDILTKLQKAIITLTI